MWLSYLLLGVAIVHCFGAANGQCMLHVHNNVPVLINADGSNRVTYAQELGAIKLVDNTGIEAHCLTGITIHTKQNGGQQSGDTMGSKELKCIKGNKIHYRNLNSTVYKDTGSKMLYITCQDKWDTTLYESDKKLPGCSSYMNYAIGVAVPNVEDILAAGMCYDLDTLGLKFVNYLAYRPKYDATPEELNITTMKSSELIVNLNKKLGQLNTFFTFMSPEAFNKTLKQKKAVEPLVAPFEFDYVSLFQDEPLRDEFAAFSHIFNTMWWRHLRLGNWRFYMDALAQRAKSVKYVVYMGTADLLQIPTTPPHQLSIEVGSLIVEPPLYIWSYLKSLQANVNEEFVVIAYNSPYYNLTGTAIFCRDMCDKIDWLQKSKFGQMRLVPTFGVIFCCRPEEVANIFKPFPISYKT